MVTVRDEDAILDPPARADRVRHQLLRHRDFLCFLRAISPRASSGVEADGRI